MNKSAGHIDEKLLLNYLLGEVTDQEKLQVDEWLIKSEENQKQLDKLEALWAETGKLTPHPVAVDMPFAWSKMSERIDAYEEEHSIKQVKVRRLYSNLLRYVGSVAAIVVIIIGISQLIKQDVQIPELTMASVDMVVQDTLPDGSQIALNTNSKLTYPESFEDDVRKVELEGEAYFDVEPDKKKPFIIVAGNAQVMVLGTSFNVKANPGADIEVAVAEGLVQLFRVNESTGDTASVFLTAGEKGKLPVESDEPEKLEEADPDDFYWMNHTFDFKKTELRKVFELLENYYDVDIHVSDSTINNCRLSTKFTNGTIIEILDVIAVSFDLEVKQKEKTFTLEGNGCTKTPKEE